MSKFYSISVVNGYAFILYLEKKNNNLTILDDEEIEECELKSFLKDKKNFHISVQQQFEFSQTMQVPIAIANSRNIKNYLLYQIKELHANIDVLFNFKRLLKQNDAEKINFAVEVLDEKSYLDSLSFVDDFTKIKSTTTSKFALLSLANRCIDDEFYICVYTTSTTIILLAVEQKELIFSRTIVVEPTSQETMQMDITENITQTISYINNQFRDIKFNSLVLAGSIALDDVISQHIVLVNHLNISVLYPNTFINNLNAEESQEHILSLGTALVSKKNQFLPKVILGIRQFNLIATIGLILSAILIVASIYFTFEEYEEYNDLLKQNQHLKTRYLKVLSQTQMLSEKKLKKYTNNISMVNKYLQNMPADQLLLLKPLIALDKPLEFEYITEEGYLTYTIKFEKHFSKLINLYKFEKEFERRLNDINTTVSIEKKMDIDYKKLIYKVELSSTTKGRKSHRKRARRK